MVPGKERAERFEELEHTADVALRVYGSGLRELFVNAAEGMFHLVGDCEHDVRPRFADRISLEAPDRESLLIDWLNELLYLLETKNACYYVFDIRSLTATSLEALVGGNPLTSHKRAIKAATFHDLRISETREGFEVTIVLDV